VNVGGLARILKMVEIIDSGIRVYQASSSEMYGNILTGRQPMALDETVPMQPVSPYGVSKLAAHKLVDTYRQRDLYVVSGILFNHESERRGMEMVTRKIARHVAQWKVLEGQEPVTPLRLGNLKAKRDWGYAPEYVRVMHKMLQQERPDDYVVGTGEAHSVFDFLLAAVQAAGWRSLDELPIESNTKHFERQDEVHCLVADNTKARVILGWEPKVGFRELVEKMVHAEIGAVEHEAQIRNRAVGV
jgi:GDPmannose 4,6-dehydratase